MDLGVGIEQAKRLNDNVEVPVGQLLWLVCRNNEPAAICKEESEVSICNLCGDECAVGAGTMDCFTSVHDLDIELEL